jgi:hypothetical protein
MEPCMCGDPGCPTCGTLQGTYLCVCGLLTDECETPAACEQRAQKIEAEQGWRDELRASGEQP